MTSVSIISDIAIPSAVLLSVCFLKVKYSSIHFVAIAIICVGVIIGFVNDFKIYAGSGAGKEPLAGDFLALLGGFLYATENVLQEHFIRKPADIWNFLGFIGMFGMIITFIESICLGELSQLKNVNKDDTGKIIANFLGMAAVEFVVYSVIPFYVSRSGATLLNLSDTTTIIWSMLFDCLLYNQKFRCLPPLAFVIEVTGIMIFSMKKPVKPSDENTEVVEVMMEETKIKESCDKVE